MGVSFNELRRNLPWRRNSPWLVDAPCYVELLPGLDICSDLSATWKAIAGGTRDTARVYRVRRLSESKVVDVLII
jgi:hypothetical protein